MTPTKVICGVIFLLSCQFVFSLVPTSPVFLWSNTNFLKGNSQNIEVVSAQEISSLFSKHSGEKIDAEVIVVFVEPKLLSVDVSSLAHANQQSNGGAFQNLKKFIESSVSSRVYQYVKSDDIANQIIRSLSSQAGQVYSIGDVSVSNAKSITFEQIKDIKLNDGVVDLIVVGFNSPAVTEENAVHDQYAADDKKIAEVLGSLSAKYLAVVASNIDTVIESEPEDGVFARNAHIRAFERQYAQNGDRLYTTYWPAGIIEALFVIWPFLLILFVGICCTVQIQSDLKFDAERVMLRRQ